jgi:tetratricopeptide (TPR) repeat protein
MRVNSAADAFTLALQHRRARELPQAERLLRQVVEGNASHVEAWQELGLTSLDMGKPADAEESFRRAIRLAPASAATHSDLGIALAQQRKFAEAEQSFREALRLQPDLAAGYNNLGLTLIKQKRLDEAIAAIRRAIELVPTFADAHNNLGLALAARGQVLDSVDCYRQALRFDPHHANAQTNLNRALGHTAHRPPSPAPPPSRNKEYYIEQAVRFFKEGRFEDAIAAFQEAIRVQPDFAEPHANLGNIYKGLGRLDEAAASYREALRIEPGPPETHHNLGLVFNEQQKPVEAMERFREAIRLKPDYAEAFASLAAVLVNRERLDEGMAAARQALRLQPDCAMAWWVLGLAYLANLETSEALRHFDAAVRLKPRFTDAHWARGVALLTENRAQEALAAFDIALQITPDHPEAHFGRSRAFLALGNLEAGFPEYEWRRECKEFVPRIIVVAGPKWDGSPLEGRTILLHVEQGLGDTLHFVRYAPLVKNKGGMVIMECQPALTRLLERTPGIDRLIGLGTPLPQYDVQASLLSLPAILGTTAETVPTDVPYVMPDERLVEQWRQELNAVPGFRIGISWQGSREYKLDKFRSIPLREFARLAEVESVRLLSLQKGQGSEQVGELAGSFEVIDWTSRLDESAGPFMDTAALMRGLDLIVTSDTANAHLAGALGVPVWVVLPFAPDWRWQLDREDSPWYPTMRLFRHRPPAGRSEVFQRVAAELRKLVISRQQAGG